MISRTNNPQAGVSLLLSILVLAAITAVAFSLAAIIAVEIRASGDLTRTEPILYAVQGVTEEAFYKYKRSVPDGSLNLVTCSPATTCTLGNVTVGPVTVVTYDNGPRVDTILAGQIKDYLLVDPASPNSFSQAYNSFSAKYLNNGAGASVTMNVYNCCDSSGNPILMSPSPITLNAGSPQATYNISGSGQYDVTLKNNAAANSVLVQVDAIRTSNSADQISLFGQQALDVSASYLGLTRKYRVQIPLP